MKAYSEADVGQSKGGIYLHNSVISIINLNRVHYTGSELACSS